MQDVAMCVCVCVRVCVRNVFIFSYKAMCMKELQKESLECLIFFLCCNHNSSRGSDHMITLFLKTKEKIQVITITNECFYCIIVYKVLSYALAYLIL